AIDHGFAHRLHLNQPATAVVRLSNQIQRLEYGSVLRRADAPALVYSKASTQTTGSRFCGGGCEANPFAPKGDCLWCDRGPGWIADRRRRNRKSGNQPERK